MAIFERPTVEKFSDGGKYWEHEYNDFYLKAYVPATDIDGTVNNYTFRAPLLVVLEETRKTKEEAVAFAKESGLAQIASKTDSSVLFVYTKADGGWENTTEELYKALISEVKMIPEYEDGICEFNNFFTKTFEGYFARGAIFRADLYGFGASADYIATKLLKKIDGEYLWGPGEITPAMCSMEGLSVKPEVERKDIAVITVGNSDEINEAFEGCENLLVKDKAEYVKDYYDFVWKFKMWCGHIELEPDLKKMEMVEECSFVEVKTSPDNGSKVKGTKTHKAGYFAYYNNNLFDNGPVPMVIGFHGGGDSSLFFTFVTEWFEIASRYGFLFVSMENHQFLTATEIAEIVDELCNRYSIDKKRIYATGFSMGSCKTWELIKEFPEKFAGFMPASALPPVKNNYLQQSFGERTNTDVSVPIFYSGGEKSHLPELPFQHETSLERIQYLAQINDLKAVFDIDFEDKDKYVNNIWTVPGESMEVVHDDTRDSDLTIQYFESKDGVVRTALASVSNQIHECRHHSCENAWKFVSKFTL